jgi:hypothetical protein
MACQNPAPKQGLGKHRSQMHPLTHFIPDSQTGSSPRAAHDSVTDSDVAPKDSKANAADGSSVRSRSGLSGFETYLLPVRVGIAGKHT